jgi:hypothetical protein
MGGEKIKTNNGGCTNALRISVPFIFCLVCFLFVFSPFSVERKEKKNTQLKIHEIFERFKKKKF